MTMHEAWSDRLSDYLDDELPPGERAEVDAHLASCPACAKTLDDLRAIVEQAAALVPQPPRSDLWDGVADRMGQAPGRRILPFAIPKRVSFTIPQLAAAGLLLATLSGAAVALVGSRSASRTVDAGTPPADDPAATDTAEVTPAVVADDSLRMVDFGDVQYDAAVADLESELERGRGRLDEVTVSVVEQNLAIIDRAIAEARGALAADPSNAYLSGHLIETRRRKLALLRRAAALAETN